MGNVDLRQSDIPFLLIVRTAGQGDAGLGLRHGVLAAVWYDGTVLRSKSQKTVTPELVKGKMQNDHMGVVLKRINDAFEGMPPSGIPMHVPGNVVYVRTRSGTRAMATNLIDWTSHPIVELRNLVFSIELLNPKEVDAEPYYNQKPNAWEQAMLARK